MESTAFQTFSIDEIIRYSVALLFVFAGLIAVLYSIWGGFLLITSGGNEEKVKPAINHIRHAVLGVVILFAIIFIAPTLANLAGLPFANSLKPGNIFTTVKELSNKMFSTSDSSSIDAPSSNTLDNFTDL